MIIPDTKAARLAAIDLKDGQFSKIPVIRGDVGGYLLSLLSKGLYRDPLDAIRELVQNSIDAGATTVTIKVTANSVLVHDDGQGMTLPDLIDARRVGISTKDPRSNVGFRGIGIYAAFDICDRLLVTTKP